MHKQHLFCRIIDLTLLPFVIRLYAIRGEVSSYFSRGCNGTKDFFSTSLSFTVNQWCDYIVDATVLPASHCRAHTVSSLRSSRQCPFITIRWASNVLVKEKVEALQCTVAARRKVKRPLCTQWIFGWQSWTLHNTKNQFPVGEFTHLRCQPVVFNTTDRKKSRSGDWIH